jgi:hypothetical protein
MECNEKGFSGYLSVKYGHPSMGADRPAIGFRAELCRLGSLNRNRYNPDDHHRRFGRKSRNFVYWVPNPLHRRPRSRDRDDLHWRGLYRWPGPECGCYCLG